MSGIHICSSILSTIRTLIQSDDFRTAYRIGNCFTRNRKMRFEYLLYFLLHQSKKSLAINSMDFFEDFPQLGITEISKQAISKARKGIHLQAFEELMRISCMQYYELQKHRSTWHGYHVFSVDGTTLQMPQTEQNLIEFGISTNQSGTKFAMASASLLFDVMNDIIIDAQINICNYSERKFALQHMSAMDCLSLNQHTCVVIFDRGYPSFHMYKELTAQNRLFIMRLKKSSKAMGNIKSNDAVIDYGPEYPKGHKTRLRVLRIPLETEDEILITNLFDESITPDMFKELYFLRWGIEGKYKELKSQFQLEAFSGSSPLAIRQDFYISMFLSNLVSILKREADEEIMESTTYPQKEYTYQSNRGFIINRIKKYLVKMLLYDLDTIKILEKILSSAIKVRSQILPNRKYERKVRHHKRKHHHNLKPCL